LLCTEENCLLACNISCKDLCEKAGAGFEGGIGLTAQAGHPQPPSTVFDISPVDFAREKEMLGSVH